jgi:HEAT repeat protein
MRGTWLILASGFFALAPASWAQESAWRPAGPKNDAEWVTYDDAGVKVLIRYLRKQGQEAMVLHLSLDTLARLGAKAKPAIPAIVETLKNPDWGIKLQAARTLLDLNAETKAAVRTLTEALRANDPSVRSAAARLIGVVVNPPLEWPSCWSPGPRPSTPRPALGRQAVPLLSKALKDEAEEVRCGAATSLGRIGADAKAVIPALLNALEDRAPAVRKAAAEASQRILVDAAARAGVKEFQRAQRENLWK